MTAGRTIGHWACVAAAAIAGSIVFAVLGLIAGAMFGGNFCNTCEFNVAFAPRSAPVSV